MCIQRYLFSHSKMRPAVITFTIVGLVSLTSCVYAYSFLDIIPFYWRYFGEGLTAWGLGLLITAVCFFCSHRSLGKLLLWIGTFLLLSGLGIYCFYPKQYSKEVPDGVYHYLPAEHFFCLA